MKKFLLFVPVAVVIGFASCKKDHVCNCVTRNTDTSVVVLEIDQDITIKATKGKADETCKENEARLNSEYGSADVTTTCTIK